MVTVTFSNQKGGCAKTTSVWALGTGLHRKGYKVLLVDLDAQSNLSFTATVDLLNLETSLYNVFCDIKDGKGHERIKDCVLEIKPGLDIVTGGLNLTSADMDFNQNQREFMLAECLNELAPYYDYCIIDTEPHLGVLTTNALCSSDMVIIPIQADIYGLQGMEQLKGFISRITTGFKPLNENLKIGGLLVTRLDERTNLSKALLEQIKNTAAELNTKVYGSKIHASVSVGESALLQDDIYTVAPGTRVASDYLSFVDEFLEG